MNYIYAKTFLLMQGMKSALPKTKWGRFGSFLIVLVGVILILGIASAGTTQDDITNGFLDIFSRMFLWVATLFLKLSVFVLSFIIEIGGYNGFVVSGAVTIGWVIVRDISNMFFVVALLVIAFGTILGLENYEWKKMLGKLFLAALLVNFSRTICGLIIDAAQVVMITFINGVAATAGGNLINAFKLDKILQLSSDYSPGNAAGVAADGNMFMAAVAGLVFSSLVIAILLVYLYILVVRMIVLWVLIVLSPLAFALTALPQTKSKYFDEWWKEFSANVIIGPFLAFFLWLSFAVVGAGDVHDHVRATSNVPDASKLAANGSSEADKIGSSAGITKAMTWDSMANFFIAIGMLWVGAEKAKNLGAAGAGALGGAQNFAKGVGKMASGVSAGMWAGKKGKELGIKGAKALGKAAFSPVTDRAAMMKERLRARRAKSSVPIFSTKGKLKREGLIAELKKGADAAEGKAKSDGSRMSYAGAGDVGKFVAENEIAKETSERRAKGDSEKAKGEILLKIEQDEMKKVEERYDTKVLEARQIKKTNEENERKKAAEEVVENARKEALGGTSNEYFKAAGDGVDLDGNPTTEITRILSDPVVEPVDIEDVQLSRVDRGKLYEESVIEHSKATGNELALSHLEAAIGSKVHGKADKEGKRMEARAIDRVRMRDNKIPTKEAALEKSDMDEDVKLYTEDWDFNDRQKEMTQQFQDLQRLNKEHDKPGKSDEEKKAIESQQKNATRAMAAIRAASISEGESEFVGGIDKSFNAVDANDPELAHLTDMSLMTGRDIGELLKLHNGGDVGQDKLREIFETEMRGRFKEKQGEILRSLMKAKNKAGKDGGEVHHFNQLMTGNDQNGDSKIMYAQLMTAGQNGSTTGKGTPRIATGQSGKKGSTTRNGKIDSLLKSKGLADIAGSSLVQSTSKETGYTVKNADGEDEALTCSDGYVKGMEELVVRASGMSESQIQRLRPDQAKRMSGGSYDHSTYHGGKFHVTEGIGGTDKGFRRMLDGYHNAIDKAVGDNNREIVRKSMRALFIAMGIKVEEARELADKVEAKGGANNVIKEI